MTYDVKPPTSTINSPVPGYVTSWNVITGSVTDNPGSAYNYPSNLATTGVQVAVKQLSGTGGWWNGTNSCTRSGARA